MHIGVLLLLSCSFFSFSSKAQSTASKSSIIIDSVSKIKEDDEGKIVLLNQNKKVLYLKNDQKNYENLLSEISNSLQFKSSLKFKTDSNLNIIDAK